MDIQTLYDIPGFDGLREVTRQFHCELTAHGGFVRRIATWLRDHDDLPEPEELASFSSDIDLVHYARPADTDAISAAIIEAIPFGESIRWQVRSAEENAIFDASMPFNGIIPANLMSLTSSTSWGIKDHWHATDLDIAKREYRYIRNGFYSGSPLFRSGRDLEIFSALLYFKILVEDVPHNRDFGDQPGLNDAKQVVHSACSSQAAITSLQENAYLRARLIYLLKDLRSLQVRLDAWKEQIPAFGLDRLAEYLNGDAMFGLGEQVSSLLATSSPIIISARLGGDQYRLPDSTAAWSFDLESAHQFKSAQTKIQLNGPPGVYQRGLGPGQSIIATSPRLPVNLGVSSSSKIGKTTHEFFHAAIPLDSATARNLKQLASSDLSVVMELAPSSENSGMPVVVSIPAVCSVKLDRYDATLYIRANALGFLEEAKSLTQCPPEETVMLQSFVVAAAAFEDSDAQSETPQSSPPTTGSGADPSVGSSPIKIASIIFVHGIFSDCASAFTEMRQSFEADSRFDDYTLYDFDYDFNDPMEKSADNLVDFIKGKGCPGPVTLICHSMGGLVARLCILGGSIPAIRLVVMLGTPNHGAVRTAQLGFLSQLAMRVSCKIYALFRKPGIKDLTRVTAIFKDPIQKGRQFADGVEYVTIPGEFFNESRPFLDTGHDVPSLFTGGFAALSVAAELLTAAPLWRVALERPHDGIVEAASNNLIPCAAGRISEKCASINHPDRFGRTYVHITHECCSDLTHVMIEHDPTIIEIVRNVTASANIQTWYKTLDREQTRVLKVVFP